MTRTMIENNKRGITSNKSLARKMLVSVAGLIWWGGGTHASLQRAADRLISALTETREMIMAKRAGSAQLQARRRVLEISARGLVFMGLILQALMMWAECPRPVTAQIMERLSQAEAPKA